MKNLSVLGSTGSIGTQCLEIVSKNRDKFNIVAMSCGHNTELFAKQLSEFKPKLACCAEKEDALKLAPVFPDIEFCYGMDGLCLAAQYEKAELVVNSLLGMMGLKPTMAAISAGKDIAFANKETLVAGGRLVMDAVEKSGIMFLPVDSEHSAIFQSLQGRSNNLIRRIILTASGGPFRGYTYEQLKSVTLAQALKHPNWSMGAKITVDSATMMNKGLEVIEASWLFNVDPKNVQVVVHPQSALHSAVEFYDGAVIGQMGVPDMKIPIAYALSYPARLHNVSEPLDFFSLGNMSFEKPDLEVFRCLKLAYSAIAAGHSYQVVMNAANEVAVAEFLAGKISFIQIADLVEKALNSHKGAELDSVESVLELDSRTRSEVLGYL